MDLKVCRVHCKTTQTLFSLGAVRLWNIMSLALSTLVRPNIRPARRAEKSDLKRISKAAEGAAAAAATAQDDQDPPSLPRHSSHSSCFHWLVPGNIVS